MSKDLAVSYHHVRQRRFAPVRQTYTERDKVVLSQGWAEQLSRIISVMDFREMPPDRDPTKRISDIPRHWATQTPGHVAVFEDGWTVTYSQLWAGIEDAQRYLQAQGVGTGDRVLIVAENCLAVITLVFALSELGAWPVVVNARLSEREIEAIRAHCRPRLMLFTHAASPDALRHGVRYRAREIAPATLAGWTRTAPCS
nr:AMP-binding protein [Cupriavidus necator]